MKGGCLCGGIRYDVSGEVDPRMQFTCHCRDCQQVTGTGHARSMGVMNGAITWTGEPKVYQIQHDASVVDTAFCSDCGSPLYKATSNLPDFTFFHVGSLDPECSTDWQSRQVAFAESRPVWDVFENEN